MVGNHQTSILKWLFRVPGTPWKFKDYASNSVSEKAWTSRVYTYAWSVHPPKINMSPEKGLFPKESIFFSLQSSFSGVEMDWVTGSKNITHFLREQSLPLIPTLTDPYSKRWKSLIVNEIFSPQVNRIPITSVVSCFFPQNLHPTRIQQDFFLCPMYLYYVRKTCYTKKKKNLLPPTTGSAFGTQKSSSTESSIFTKAKSTSGP